MQGHRVRNDGANREEPVMTVPYRMQSSVKGANNATYMHAAGSQW